MSPWLRRPGLSLHYFVSDGSHHCVRCVPDVLDGHFVLDGLDDLDGLDGLDIVLPRVLVLLTLLARVMGLSYVMSSASSWKLGLGGPIDFE